MSCDVYRALASDRLDGCLPPAESRELEAHLVLCRECRHEAAELAELKGLLGARRDEGPSRDEELEILARVNREKEPPGLALWSRLGPSLPRRMLSSSVAAGLLLAVVAANIAAPEPSPVPPALPVPGVYEMGLPREASLLTVWDSHGDTIVTTVDPVGLTGIDEVIRVAREPTEPVEPTPFGEEVRIFLFERIVVRG